VRGVLSIPRWSPRYATKAELGNDRMPICIKEDVDRFDVAVN
jgi:hypothetical protein